MSRRPLVAAFIAPAVALLAGLGRWATQGSGNLYTSTDKRFYLPDPDLGWRLAPKTYLWLGLDALAVIVGLAAALGGGALVIARLERRSSSAMPRARTALLVASALPLVIPIAGFAAGSPPEGAAESLPDTSLVAAGGIEASLPSAPAGVYQVIEHPGSVIAAEIKAGGETFEARFAGGIRGQWRGDPTDLGQPMRAEIAVAVASVKTGIELRDTHAAEKLEAAKHPELLFSLTEITGARRIEDRKVGFAGKGSVTIIGETLEVPVSGTVTELDEAGKRRLDLDDAAALVVSANLEIDLDATPVDTSGGTFDKRIVPVRVSLVLVNQGEP